MRSRTAFPCLLLVVAGGFLAALTGCSASGTNSDGGTGGGTGGDPGGAQNPVPTLTSATPTQVAAHNPGTTFTLTGSNFTSTSTAMWSGYQLATTFQSATSLTAHAPWQAFASTGVQYLSVMNPAPGGGTSNSVSFSVVPASLKLITVPTIAYGLVWEPASQKLFLSNVGSTWLNGTSIQSLDPVTGTLGTPITVGPIPDQLAVSANSKYLYVALDSVDPFLPVSVGQALIQRITLPALTLDQTFPVRGYAPLQILPSAIADDTIAVIGGDLQITPKETGGILIYDRGVPRPNWLCGDSDKPYWNSCIDTQYASGDWNSAAWSPDETLLYAYDGASTAADAFTATVDSSGFRSVSATQVPYYGGSLPTQAYPPQSYFSIHYDTTTGYAVTDDGLILNPSNWSVVNNLQHIGVAIPDGKLGAVFMVSWIGPEIGYELDSFDIHTGKVIASYLLPTVVGQPAALIRWGTDGLALLTKDFFPTQHPPVGSIYLMEGVFIGNPTAAAK